MYILTLLTLPLYEHTWKKFSVEESYLHTHTHICNFKEWIEAPQAWSREQGRAYSFSLRRLLTLTYRRCITWQYCTEVCRQGRADTSKKCGKFSLLHRASQPCHRCSKLGQRGAGTGQAWLKASVAGFKDGSPTPQHPHFPLGGVEVGGVSGLRSPGQWR